MSSINIYHEALGIHDNNKQINSPLINASKKSINEEPSNLLDPRGFQNKHQRIYEYILIDYVFLNRKALSFQLKSKVEEKKNDQAMKCIDQQYSLLKQQMELQNLVERRKLKEHQLSLIKQMNAKYTQSMDQKQFGKVVILSTSVKPVKNKDQNLDHNGKRLSINSINLDPMSSKQTFQKLPDEDKSRYSVSKRFSISHNIVKPIENDNSFFFTGVDNSQKSQPNIKIKKAEEKQSSPMLPQLVELHSDVSLNLNQKMHSLLPKINSSNIQTSSQSKENVPASNQPSIIQTKKLLEAKKEQEEREPSYERIRDFKIKFEQKQFLFEGLKFVQFEPFVIKEPSMQGLVVRDVLKILGDKAISFKNYLIDRNKMRKVFASLSSNAKIQTNAKFEQLIGLLERIALIISQDFKEYKDVATIGENPMEEYRKKADEFYKKMKEIQQEQEELLMKKNEQLLQFSSPKGRGSPQNDSFFQSNSRKIFNSIKNLATLPAISRVKDTQEFIKIPLRYDKRYPYYRPIIDTVKQEPYVFEDNIQLYDKVTEFIKGCIDSFRVLSRQREFKQLNDIVCEELLKLTTQTRYFLSEFGEELRMFEKNNEDKVKWQKYYEQEKIRSENSMHHNQLLSQSLPHPNDSLINPHPHHPIVTEEIKQEEIEKDKNEKLEFIYRVQKLTSLLFNKFNYKRNRFQTRESKVILNQEYLFIRFLFFQIKIRIFSIGKYQEIFLL